MRRQPGPLKSELVSIPPTGEQYEIVSGGHRAVVTEVGATLRSYSRDGVDVVRGFAEQETVKGGRGQNLLPWPNRIRDGKYTFAGQSQQLWLSEPARHNASHGLVRYVPWVLTDRTRRLGHQPGAHLPAARLARLARGQRHPRVVGGRPDRHRVGDQHRRPRRAVRVRGPPVPDRRARRRSTRSTSRCRPPSYLEVDPDRLLPVRISPVDGTDLDLRDGPTVGLPQPGQRDDRPDPRRRRPLASHPHPGRADRGAVGRRDA